MRRAIGRRMTASKQQAPHFYISSEIEVDAALARVGALRESSGERVSLTALLLRAVVVALSEHPALNAVWQEDELMLAEEPNVGVAIALDDGLVAPALFARDATDVLATARALDDLVTRARERKLRGAEMTGATFTVSNLGMFEVSSFIPIVTPPQVAILGVGKTRRVAGFEDDRVVPRSLMTVTLSADHRAVDGADVARFLATLKSTIEHPEELDA
ncbi:MAG TPA: 2-oxo acid dehydrogenase subunit E2 [Conexibacter sp.]|nr:2-oxo acid dehydrogenase subunit E2 [Conexibacter sp.]